MACMKIVRIQGPKLENTAQKGEKNRFFNISKTRANPADSAKMKLLRCKFGGNKDTHFCLIKE